GGVDTAGLRVGAFVFKDQLLSRLAERKCNPVHAAIARPAAFDGGAVAPGAGRQARELVEERGLAVVEDLAHHAFDGIGAIPLDEREDAVARRGIPRQLRPEVERHRGGLSRAPEIDLLDVPPDLISFDDLDGWKEDAFVEGVARG